MLLLRFGNIWFPIALQLNLKLACERELIVCPAIFWSLKAPNRWGTGELYSGSSGSLLKHVWLCVI